jgi:hypothetical protein
MGSLPSATMTLFCDRNEIFAGASFGIAQNKPIRANAVSMTSIVLFIGGPRGWILVRAEVYASVYDLQLW